MTVPKGQTICIGNRTFKAGKEIPKHLESKLKKTQKESSPARPDVQAKPGNNTGKK